jgi:hypothetical protein
LVEHVSNEGNSTSGLFELHFVHGTQPAAKVDAKKIFTERMRNEMDFSLIA